MCVWWGGGGGGGGLKTKNRFSLGSKRFRGHWLAGMLVAVQTPMHVYCRADFLLTFHEVGEGRKEVGEDTQEGNG